MAEHESLNRVIGGKLVRRIAFKWSLEYEMDLRDERNDSIKKQKTRIQEAEITVTKIIDRQRNRTPKPES